MFGVSDDSYTSRWVESKHKSDMGPWKYTAGKWYGDAEKDKGKFTNDFQKSTIGCLILNPTHPESSEV